MLDQSSQSTDTLPGPIPTQGDRKNLLNYLTHLSPQFESKITDLKQELDRVYVNSPATIRDMEEAQREIQVVNGTVVVVFVVVVVVGGGGGAPFPRINIFKYR